jgi:hypothetical protein
VHWSESIVIDRPITDVRPAVVDQHRLMRWSAWPEATGFTCSVDGDGTSVGSAIVFRDGRGREQGWQEMVEIQPDVVRNRLRNRGPGGREMRPEVDFRMEAIGSEQTRVRLDFRVDVPLPPVLRQLAEAVIGRRVRALHVADLEQLKAHVESPTPV